MSVYNRKMFKRNARDTLNKSAGVADMPVQKFQAGGAVFAPLEGLTVDTGREGTLFGSNQRFLAPMVTGVPAQDYLTTVAGVERAKKQREQMIALKAAQEGLGALDAGQFAMYQSGLARQQSSLLGDKPSPNEMPITGIARTALSGIGELMGFGTSPVVGLGTRPQTPPDRDYLESLGFQFYTPQTTEEAAAKAQQMRQGAARLTGSMDPAGQIAEEEARKEAMLGVQEFPEVGNVFENQEPPQVPYAPDRSGPDLDLSSLEQVDAEEDVDKPTSETTTTQETTTDSSGTYDDAIVRMAREANKEQGIPDTGTATSEINIAKETGTGSVEDLKAEYLKLLPKYEEDPSVLGLNIALMGFAIAGGESPNAMKNIADGMKEVMPKFIKSAQKKKAFERESELVAAKFAIERDTKLKDQAFDRNNYFVTSDFTGRDGVEYKAGQMLRLNDAAFDVLGAGSNLMDGATYRQMINDKANVEKAIITANASSQNSIDDFYTGLQTKKFGNDDMGLEIEVFLPTVAGSQLNLQNRLSGGPASWAAVTEQYVSGLDAMAQTDASIEAAKQLVNEGATGIQGALGNLKDATVGAIGPDLAAKMGIDPKLSAAGEMENLNRIMTLQMARIILNEGGKMISNQERVQVAKAMGYGDATLDGSGNIILGSFNNVFTSKEKALDALNNVQQIIRNRAVQHSSNYTAAAKYLGYDFKPVEEATQPDTQAFGGVLEKRDDGKFYFTQQ